MAVTRRTLLTSTLAVPAGKKWLPDQRWVPAPKKPHPPPPPPQGTALLGASFHSGELLPDVVDRLDFHRFFFSPNKMLARRSWSQQAALATAHNRYGCRSYSISFKPDSGPVPFTQPDNIRWFLDSVPNDVDPSEVYLTFFHEHDGNIRKGELPLSLYRQGSEVVAGIADEFGMQYGPIHNGVVFDPVRRWGLWPNIWAANEADLGLYTFWGVDLYSNNYEDPAWMNPTRAYADSLGLPLLVGEIASPFGPRQAAWAADAREWALSNTERASWWSSQVSADSTNYRLTDESARAWFGLN